MPCRCDFEEDLPPRYVDPVEVEKRATCRAQHLIYKLRKLIPGEIPEALRPGVEQEINALYEHKVNEALKDFLQETDKISLAIQTTRNNINKIKELGGIVPAHLAAKLEIEEEKLINRKFVKPSIKELLG